MPGCISVINSGSSSIKFSLFDNIEAEELRLLFKGQVGGIGVAPRFKVQDGHGERLAEEQWDNDPEKDHHGLMAFIIGWIRERRQQLGLELRGVGHRVVHGGELYSAPVRVNDGILESLEKFIPLAPLHQPHNLAPIRAVMQLSSTTPQVACFDTAFHRTNPQVAQQFGLPRHLSESGIRRYGFHGLSYEYIARRLYTLDPELAAGRVIVAHLGSGASMCGLRGGQSIASTMGFSAMDGLMMGTRPGNLDPGVVLYLMQEKGMTEAEILELLYKKSGLLGVSGISNDMRVLLKSEAQHAREAIALFVYRIQREMGSLAAALGGVDGLVFTAGIGEHSPVIRSMIAKDAAWLGVELDPDVNEQGPGLLSTKNSRVSVWALPTNEELMIATHTRDLLEGETSCRAE